MNCICSKSPHRSQLSLHTPRTKGHSKVRTPKSCSYALFSPGMLRRTNILTQTDCLKPKILHMSRVEPTTNERAPETPCRLAYFATRVPCSRERGAARSAPKARAVRPRKSWHKSSTDPLRISELRIRGARFWASPSPPGRELRGDES